MFFYTKLFDVSITFIIGVIAHFRMVNVQSRTLNQILSNIFSAKIQMSVEDSGSKSLVSRQGRKHMTSPTTIIS